MTFNRRSEIMNALNTLSCSGRVVEVRIITQDGIGSGYFDNFEKLADQVCILDDNPQIRGIYVTLNEVNPVLLARRANRIIMRLSKKDATTADKDILKRHWLPIDIDPVRPSGVSSSNEEHEYAIKKAYEIAAYLRSVGWPEPVIADSGNGAHLLYPINLPNDTASSDLVKNCLFALSARFSDSICTVDTANYNAARIWKLYGTMTRKGDNTPPRSHRPASLKIDLADPSQVPDDMLRCLAELYPTEKEPRPSSRYEPRTNRTDQPEIDLASWFSHHDISCTQKPYGDGTLFLLDQCPFSEDHRDGAYAIQFESGAIFAGCHHTSCGSGMQRWKELRKKYDGIPDIENRLSALRKDRIKDRYLAGRDASNRSDNPETCTSTKNQAEKQNTKKNRPDPKQPDTKQPEQKETNPDLFPDTDPEIEQKAIQILREEKPIRYMLETFAMEHEGDLIVAECLILSLASRLITNSKGLHVSITGESGKGKSHAIDTMLSHIPEEFRLSGRMSDKALFYAQDIRAGSVIALDDVTLSEQMQEILKGVTTSFLHPFRYRTVTKDRSGITCTIPERCVWWIAKVEGSGDDQIFNRMLTVWIDDSDELDKKVLDRTLKDAAQMPKTVRAVKDAVLIIRQMWRLLQDTWVIIPYAELIEFQSVANRRNPDMLLDLIKANASLMQYQRERWEIDGMVCVVACKEDFWLAARLYDALSGDTGGQVTKLTRRESALIEAIMALKQEEITVLDIQRNTGWTNSAISKLLNGYSSRGNLYSGLLEKCPAISFYDRSVTVGDPGQTTHRRTKVYVWDQTLYNAWIRGGTVTLREQTTTRPGHDPHDPHGPHDPHSPGDDTCSALAEKSAANEHLSARAETKTPEDNTQNSTCTDILRDTRSFSATCTNTQHHHPGSTSFGDCTCADQCAETDAAIPADSASLKKRETQSGRTHEENSKNRSETQRPCVKPDEYVLIEGWPEKTPCLVCGRSPTRYRRLQTEREEKTRYICADCYNRAVSRHIASIVTLPGVVSTDQMVRLRAPAGKCPVCKTLPVIWYDQKSQLGLCESCYLREKARSCQEETV